MCWGTCQDVEFHLCVVTLPPNDADTNLTLRSNLLRSYLIFNHSGMIHHHRVPPTFRVLNTNAYTCEVKWRRGGLGTIGSSCIIVAESGK